ncbi:hypothetical protein FOXB_16849 [Fusarium oxysporum f. sp. conglutinans Fo5176]|uniref:Uncharacterized protein n=1 Tax=Fusarium oxysporum (strain Fo5176) TaxID=660025 RepID=F9GDW5_FUSOF|nr:hypothetical protein FOXB_16849 [Fusarium oxysporum f. sp. conglutinans Fo5176]
MSGDQDHSSISADAQDFVDMNIFEQILELDDEGQIENSQKNLSSGSLNRRKIRSMKLAILCKFTF